VRNVNKMMMRQVAKRVTFPAVLMNDIAEKWRERLAWAVDILLAAAITGAALYEIWLGTLPNAGIQGPRLPNTVIVVLIGLALVLRRKTPVVTLFVVVGAVLIQREIFTSLSIQTPLEGFFALLLAFYSAPAYGKLRRAAIGGAVAGVAIIATDLPYLVAGHPRLDTVPSWIFMSTVWFIGWAFHRRRIQATRAIIRAREAGLGHGGP
jgi:hypothetical protein